MRRWQVIPDDAGGVMLCRPGASRLDLAVAAAFPRVRPLVLAHEVRKDLWRQLRSLRGFSPVVRVVPCDDRAAGGLFLTAGGQMALPVWPRQAVEAMVAALLADPDRRARWIAHARLR